MNKLNSALVILLSVLLSSCAEQADNENRKSKENGELEQKAQQPRLDHQERAYYPIPSPEQMFGFINDAGVKYSKTLMNPSGNYQSYITPSVKALNFGIYTADLAYSAAYQDIESTLSLYKVVRMMGSDLNIEEMMSEEMMTDMQAHLQDKDSLAIIAGKSYYQAVEFLEDNGQEGKLALMSLGGWIESLYITINAVESFDQNSETAQRIADQKITFGNLYTYLKKNEDKPGIVNEIKSIQGVRAVFGSLIETKSIKKSKDLDSKMILGSPSRIEISEGQFNALKAAISEYRNNITKV